ECGHSILPEDTGNASATDNCSAAITITHSDAPATASCTGLSGIDRTWKATDGCGNVATAVQHIVFVDTTPPTLNVPADQQLQCGDSTDPLKIGAATASDNCAAAVTITHADAAAAPSCTGVSGIDRTWK